MQRSLNSFFRFVLGFTVFIGVGLGLTYAVATIEMEQQKEEQTAAAFRAMVGDEGEPWWERIFD
ncbi:MAG TPA: hypothetical protein VNM40_03680 [Candidatus Paceibacterota bacterium]|nr:hypothetical protein [Candidatus Paceibacterota bacterium]